MDRKEYKNASTERSGPEQDRETRCRPASDCAEPELRRPGGLAMFFLTIAALFTALAITYFGMTILYTM